VALLNLIQDFNKNSRWGLFDKDTQFQELLEKKAKEVANLVDDQQDQYF
jgi:hypothetical protein